jgi:hypothetical protein
MSETYWWIYAGIVFLFYTVFIYRVGRHHGGMHALARLEKEMAERRAIKDSNQIMVSTIRHH